MRSKPSRARGAVLRATIGVVTISALSLSIVPVAAAAPATGAGEGAGENERPIEGPVWQEIVEIEAPPAPTREAPDDEPVAGASQPAEGSTDPQDPAAAIEPPPPTLAAAAAGELVYVAVGLSSELDGSKPEKALLDRLERAATASPAPSTVVRRLRVGSAGATAVCREGRDDLVIMIGYLPDRPEPVLLTRDCLLDRELGTRADEAADDPDLVGVLWREHQQAVDDGARVRRRLRISPKARTGLIAGAAVAVIGVAVGLLIVSAVRRETVVITVSPSSP